MEDARLLQTDLSLISPESCGVHPTGNNNNGSGKGRVVFALGLLVVLSNCGLLIATPLWLDSAQDAGLIHHSNCSLTRMHPKRGERDVLCIFKLQRSNANESIFQFAAHDKNTSFPISNMTNGSDPSHRIAVSFVIFLGTAVCMVSFGFIVLVLWKCFPGKYITEREYSYPKSQCIKAGIFASLNGIMAVYASRGNRTAPYLQSILINAAIPITFITRFILLRKRPTARKLVCAVVVMLGELLALVTTIFPSLEPESARRAEGGAQHGAGRILWPLCFTLAYVPFAIYNCIMESNLKGEKKVYAVSAHVNTCYFIFWQVLTTMIIYVALVWIDIIPGFGTSPNITELGKSLWFTIRCTAGGAECPGSVSVFAFINCLSLFMLNLSGALFLKHTEGTNLLTITISLSTPVVLLFWTLFVESPFHWAPHVQLSTWLSLAAVCIILPAIVVYNTGPPEVVAIDLEESPNTSINTVPKYGSVDIIT